MIKSSKQPTAHPPNSEYPSFTLKHASKSCESTITHTKVTQRRTCKNASVHLHRTVCTTAFPHSHWCIICSETSHFPRCTIVFCIHWHSQKMTMLSTWSIQAAFLMTVINLWFCVCICAKENKVAVWGLKVRKYDYCYRLKPLIPTECWEMERDKYTEKLEHHRGGNWRDGQRWYAERKRRRKTEVTCVFGTIISRNYNQ